MISSVEDLLVLEEGEKLHAYLDHLGFLTIGVGRLIDKRKGGGITKEESRMLLRNDIKSCEAVLLRKFKWYDGLDPVRKGIVLSMMFQVGDLAKWPRFCNAMAVRDFIQAAKEMMDSKVAKEQTPLRWNRAAHAMITGQWPKET